MPNDPTPEQLSEWRRLAEAATPPPWMVAVAEQGSGTSAPALAYIEGPRWVHHDRCTWLSPEDGVFFAAARTAVPALLDALSAAQAEVKQLKTELTACQGYLDTERVIVVGLRKRTARFDELLADLDRHRNLAFSMLADLRDISVAVNFSGREDGKTLAEQVAEYQAALRATEPKESE